MASDVQAKHEGPLWKPEKLTRQGVRDLNRRKGLKKSQQKVYKYYWQGPKADPKWLACRRAWFDQNPPDYRGLYVCALCSNLVRKSETTLDHILTCSQRPDLKYDLDNLQPAHGRCNFERGSMTMEAWNERRKSKIKSPT